MKSLGFSPVWFSCKSGRIGKEKNYFWGSSFPLPLNIVHPVPIAGVGLTMWSVQQYNYSSKALCLLYKAELNGHCYQEGHGIWFSSFVCTFVNLFT